MEKRIEEGPPIYIESLMTPEEIKQRCRTYPTTSHIHELRPLSDFKSGLMKWRWRMGMTLLPSEIVVFNREIENLRKKLMPQHDTHRAGDGHYPGIPFHP